MFVVVNFMYMRTIRLFYRNKFQEGKPHSVSTNCEKFKFNLWLYELAGHIGNEIFFRTNVFCVTTLPAYKSKWSVISMLSRWRCYVLQCIPLTWNDLQTLHIIFMALNVVMWVSLYHASTSDPGYLPRNIPEYDQTIREVRFITFQNFLLLLLFCTCLNWLYILARGLRLKSNTCTHIF